MPAIQGPALAPARPVATVKKATSTGPAYPPVTFGAPTAAGAPGAATPYSSLLAAITKPVDTAGILKTAHTQALQDTGSIVSALRGQQAADNAAAQQRAAEIGRASLGASKFLSSLNLGSGLQSSLTQAAGDQASLASGFSGQLQQDVGAQGSKVLSALQAIGAPGGVPSTADKAGNVVYGTGGLLPADAMLAAAPVLKSQADQAPAALIGQGQQEAVGAIGAGKQQAERLDPQIAAEAAKLPATEQKYVAQLTTAAEKSRQDAIGNVATAIKLQQAGDTAAATAAYRKAELANRKATLAETKAARLAKQRDFTVTSGEKTRHDVAMETTSRITANNASTKYNNSQLPKFSPTVSGKLGFRADQYGAPIDGGATLPGFRKTAAGGYVKVSTTKTPTFSATQIKDTADAIHTWKTGQTGSKAGVPVIDPTKQLTYGDALTRTIARGPTTPEWKQKATQLVNAEYGTPQSIALQAAKDAKSTGHGLTDAVKVLMQQKSGLPLATYVPALAKVYGFKPADVVQIIDQLGQLTASGQVPGG